MRFGSVCSGIEAAAVAWHPLGWRAAWCAEIEPFPSAVLAHHYPTVPNMGDMTKLPDLVRLGLLEAPDVLVGGTPCQAFSVAGLRHSLADDRGNLTLSYFHLLDAIDHARAERNEPACIAVWENVPGVLSTKDNAFGCFLAGLAGESDALLPPGGKWSDAGVIVGPARAIAWRILDAQYFGLAQRRRRVFVVASARNDIDPAAILFEFEGVRRDSPPSRETGQEATAGTYGCAGIGSYENNGHGPDDPTGPLLKGSPSGGGYPLPPVAVWPAQVASTLNAHFGDKMGLEDQHALGGASLFVPAVMGTITARMFNSLGARDVEAGAVIAFNHNAQACQLPSENTDTTAAPSLTCSQGAAVALALRGREGGATAEVGDECAFALRASSGGGDKPHVLSIHENQRAEITLNDTAGALNSGGGKPGQGYPTAFTSAMQVRRLTPRECERLQGFPDDYTLVPHRNKPAAAGPRYKALGNSMAVPCMAWIGARIAAALL